MKKAKAKGNVKGNAKANAKAKVTYAPFEVADYLDSEEAIAEYLSLAVRDENPAMHRFAIGNSQCVRHELFADFWIRMVDGESVRQQLYSWGCSSFGLVGCSCCR